MSQTRQTTASLVLNYLVEHGPTVVSQDKLAETIQRSRRSVQTAVVELVERGLVDCERQRDERGYRSASLLSAKAQSSSLNLEDQKALSDRAPEWPAEVSALRDAMVDAGIVTSWRRLRADVIDELVSWVRSIGIARLVREAKARIWSPCVRHVAAFLRFWRDMRPPRPLVCPMHPHVELPRGARCDECAAERAAAVPMPDSVRRMLDALSFKTRHAHRQEPTRGYRPPDRRRADAPLARSERQMDHPDRESQDATRERATRSSRQGGTG